MTKTAAFPEPDQTGGQPAGLRAALKLPSIRVLGDFVKKQGTELEEREIPDYEVLYFPEGTLSVYRVGEREFSLNKPCFVLTRPGEVHSYRYDPHKPTRHLFIHFWLKALPDDLLAVLQPDGPSVIPYQGELLFSLMKQINAIAFLRPDKLQDRGSLLLLSLLSEIDALAADESPETERLPPQLAKALSVIDSHPSSPLTVDQLARQVGWTPEHLARSFSRHLGMTPKETIVRKKIDRACQLLLYGRMSVKEIAFEVGFADENYFCRVFKAAKAITATDYRAKYYKPKYEDLAPANDEDALYPSNRVFFGDF
ncbi:helix-turn-helix domain-containing protein [Cohnella cellulosilytica]|uniref:Helix-turn-helix domain-containing protein n=1 Tax=Cohnella cellulosilytica TaxID=986710 RepID=A0ABW2FB93_9BACL